MIDVVTPPLALSVNYMVKCGQVGEQNWMQIDKILTEIERAISGGLKTSLMFFSIHWPLSTLLHQNFRQKW